MLNNFWFVKKKENNLNYVYRTEFSHDGNSMFFWRSGLTQVFHETNNEKDVSRYALATPGLLIMAQFSVGWQWELRKF